MIFEIEGRMIEIKDDPTLTQCKIVVENANPDLGRRTPRIHCGVQGNQLEQRGFRNRVIDRFY